MLVLGTSARKGVWVRIPPAPPDRVLLDSRILPTNQRWKIWLFLVIMWLSKELAFFDKL